MSVTFHRAVWLAAITLGIISDTPALPPSPTVASIMDAQLTTLQNQFLPAAEAMPEAKYSFVPRDGDQNGVRTFALEVKHVATANLIFYSAILGRSLPAGVSLAGATNGPDEVATKEQILQYLKNSFALGHEALASLTTQNATIPLANSPVPQMNTRLALATWSCAHAWDHYGQMVEYLRLNGIVPPASGGQPLASPASILPQPHDGSHDFDFHIGNWKAHVRVLVDRLNGSRKWVVYDGISNHKKLLDSSANFEEFDAYCAELQKRNKGQTLRLYNPDTHQWSIYLVDLDKGTLSLPPVIGEFSGNRGEFYNQDAFKGRAIYVVTSGSISLLIPPGWSNLFRPTAARPGK